VRERVAGAAAPEARWLRDQAGQLEGLLQLYEEELADKDESRAIAERTLEEIRRRTAEVTLLERLESAARRLGELWRSELFAVDDRPVTLGKVVAAFLLFTLGFTLARLVTRVLGALVLRRIAVQPGIAAAIQSLVFYALVVVFFVIAMRTVNIPLTIFTLAGGALAIGVGFGSQNIVNNFISGLVLLTERPIKMGDIVEIDGMQGHVEQIGARSTRVRTFDNVHIIVPNSAFLEKNVVNWTLSDDVVRAKVDVGVSYGSPPREVDRLISRAIQEHGQILESPEPMVLFHEFGDNALVFRAYFWLRVQRPIAKIRIESDVRYRIEHLLRDAGIVIAFPQRDVHLDTSSPLDVRVLTTADGAVLD